MVKQKGFTIIELLVVITILSILTSSIIILVKPQEMRNRAQDAVRKQDVSVIAGSLERYYADNNSYPDPASLPANPDEFSANGVVYLKIMPKDPDGNNYVYTQDTTQDFSICTTLEVPGTETNPFCIENAF